MSSTKITDKYIFCLLNCFNNYEVVAGKLVEFYISNAITGLNPGNKSPKILNYFNSTPFILYSEVFLPGETIPQQYFPRSKQLIDFVTLISLTAVTLARIKSSEITVFAHQGVVLNTGFATMYTIANQLNIKTAYWTDDLRNIWGTTDDPLFIGMAPLPYKYLWTSGENPAQKPEFNSQPKGLNGSLVQPNLAKTDNLCPVVSQEKFKNNWNSFIDLFNRSNSIQKQNTGTITNSRINNLIKLGNLMIKYVEIDKGSTQYSSLGLGWNPSINTTIYSDLEFIISQNLSLLYLEEQDFFKTNTNNTPNLMTFQRDINNSKQDNSKTFNKKYFPNVNEYNKNSKDVYMAMSLGFAKMTK